MLCPKCQAEVPDGKRFCMECGAPITLHCTSCGSRNPPTARFCGDCGNRLNASGSWQPYSFASPEAEPRSDASAAERRQLTVMFCDLVGSTALSARLDPEDLQVLLGAYRRCVTETVVRFDGYVAKYMGDGVLVYFGWPQAHEEDAERAVRAALALARSVEQIAVAQGKLQVRIGIATGLVVVGDLIGTGDAQERGVVGETPNLAARLQAFADPGAVVVAGATRRLVGDLFECRDLGVLDLKGLDAVRAWHIQAESSVESRFDALRSREAPLFGRQAEISSLLQRWNEAKRGSGLATLIFGEPGIGKSRLVTSFQDQMRDQPHIPLRYYCSPYHTNSVLEPVIRHLEKAAGFDREDPGTTKVLKLESLLAGTSATDEEFNLLCDLLLLPVDRELVSALTPHQRKEKTLEALVRYIRSAAAKQPVLMVVEDAHWMDPTSQDLLARIVQLIENWPVFLVVTSRPEFHPPWAGHPRMSTIEMNRLGQRDGCALAEHVGGGKRLPSDVVRQIIERTDGVPLFIEELTKTLIENQLLVEQDGRYVLTGPLPEVAIPSTLQGLLMARLDRLSTVKEVAQIAAVVGRDFSYELVSEMTRMEPLPLARALQQLEDAGLVFRKGLVPEATYTFKHALIHDAAHESLLRARRHVLHGRLGDLIEQRHSETAAAQPELLAWHFSEARQYAKAVNYWLQAGRRALERSAVPEALAHFQRGLEQIGHLPPGPVRAGLELDLELGIASASISVRGYAAKDTEEAFARARSLLEHLGDDPRQFAVLYGLFVVQWNRARLGKAVEVASELLDRAARSEETAPICVGHRALAVAYNAMGRFSEAFEQAEAAASFYDREAHRSSAIPYGHDIGVAALMHQCVAAAFLGRADLSAEFAGKGRALAQAIGHANTIGYAELWFAFTGLVLRDPAGAISTAERLVPFAEERQMAFWTAVGRCTLGSALCASGDTASGLELLENGLAHMRAARIRIYRPVFLCFKAGALQRLGRFEEALSAADLGLNISRLSGEQWWEPELLRQRADTCLAQGNSDAPKVAQQHFRAAIAAAERQNSRCMELRAAVSLARLWAEGGQHAEARDLLAPVYSRVAAGVGATDIEEAKQLLGEV